MEETQIELQETIHKISRLPLSLKISKQGEIDLKGDIASEDLQVVLDASHVKTNLYLEHQKQLDRESNLMVIYIGLIFSSLIGLICFCALNQSPKYTTYQQSLGVRSHEFNG
jgi:hypothetical protein